MKIAKVFLKQIISQEQLKKYEVIVGVLDGSTKARLPAKGFKKKGLQGHSNIPARATGKAAKITVKKLAGYLANRYNFIDKAVKSENNKDLTEVQNSLLECLIGAVSNPAKRYLNACRAFIRNPIIRKEFGSNAARTIKIKGFNHPLILTGTFFKNIIAKFIHGNGNIE